MKIISRIAERVLLMFYMCITLFPFQTRAENSDTLPIVAVWEISGFAIKNKPEKGLYYALYKDGTLVFSQDWKGRGKTYTTVVSSNTVSSIEIALSTNQVFTLSRSKHIMLNSGPICFMLLSVGQQRQILARTVTASDWLDQTEQGSCFVNGWESVNDEIHKHICVTNSRVDLSHFSIPAIWNELAQKTLRGRRGYPENKGKNKGQASKNGTE